MPGRWDSRFDDHDGDPMAAMATLVDVMLVFACGLMAALVLGQGRLQDAPEDAAKNAAGGQEVQRGRNLQEVPRGVGDVGGGYRPVGRVFRDPASGKLILVESPDGAAPAGAQ